MGNAYYTVRLADGSEIEAGYDVTGRCHQAGCSTETSRGLESLCGDEPGGGEAGCGRYFCDSHLLGAPTGETGYLCAGCMPETDDDFNRIPA